MKSIEQIMAEIEAERIKAGEEAEETRLILAAAMASTGVETVDIYFSGCGDSGQIDEISIVMREGFMQPTDLPEKLEDWAYKFLEGTGVDWYNNDGGQGKIHFDLTTAPPRFRAYVDVNVTNSETVFEIEEGA